MGGRGAELSSIEIVSVLPAVVSAESEGGGTLSGWLDQRLGQLADVLERREWIAAGRFTVADILLADVLRQAEGTGGPARHPALGAYVARTTARPALAKAHADRLAHFAAGDAARAKEAAARAGESVPVRRPASADTAMRQSDAVGPASRRSPAPRPR